jgi:hypothetical protein
MFYCPDERMKGMAESEVARIKRKIEAEYEAALRGLTGLAMCARHDFINARLQHIGDLETELSKHVGPVRAMETLIEIHDRHVQQYQEQLRAAEQGVMKEEKDVNQVSEGNPVDEVAEVEKVDGGAVQASTS